MQATAGHKNVCGEVQRVAHMSDSIATERAEFELEHLKRMLTLELLGAGLELLQKTGVGTTSDMCAFRAAIKEVCFPPADLRESREEQMTAALRRLGISQLQTASGSYDGSLL